MSVSVRWRECECEVRECVRWESVSLSMSICSGQTGVSECQHGLFKAIF